MPSGPLRRALRAMAVDVAPLPGAGASGLPALAAVFEQAGLTDLVTTTIDVTVGFPDFRDFWESQTTSYSPTTKIVDGLSASELKSLAESLHTLGSGPVDGSIHYSACANAVKARNLSGMR